jgi:hypothetical protein
MSSIASMSPRCRESADMTKTLITIAALLLITALGSPAVGGAVNEPPEDLDVIEMLEILEDLELLKEDPEFLEALKGIGEAHGK